MAIALVQSQRAQANASSVGATYPGATTSGNLLVAIGYTNGAVGTLNVSGWTAHKTNYSGTANSIGIFYKIANGTETTITLNGNSICRLHIAEFSGLANPVETDGSNSNAVNTVQSINTNDITTTNADDLIVVCAGTSTGASGTRSWNNSFSVLLDDATSPRLLSGYRIVSSTGTYNSTGTLHTSNTNCGALIIAFKASPAGGTTTDQTITGKARISKIVQRTITGKARISKTVQRTIAGKANIRANTTRNISGRARIRKDTTTEIKIINNVIVDPIRETAIGPIFDALEGITYKPFEAFTTGLGYFEIGDRIKVKDPREDEAEVLIFDIKIEIGPGLREQIKSPIPDKTNTPYQYAGIIGQRIRNTEIIVDKQKGEITLVSENLNQAISQITITTDSITQAVNQSIAIGDANSNSISTLQTNLAQLQLTANALEVAVSGIGGTNLLKNSVGLKGDVKEWQILDSDGNPTDARNDASIDQTIDVDINSESGSALVLQNQFIKQTFATIIGQTYTFYCRYKSTLTATLKITGITDTTLPASASWAVYKKQFVAVANSTTLHLENGGGGAIIRLTDLVAKLGDANGWVQAPNEVYGKNFRFDKDGFEITSLTDAFKSVLDNQKLAVYDTSTGRIVMLVSKDSGKITKLTAQDEFVLRRYENENKSLRMIPTDTGVMIVIND